MKQPRYTHTYHFDKGDFFRCYLIGPNPLKPDEAIIAQRNKGTVLHFDSVDRNFLKRIKTKPTTKN